VETGIHPNGLLMDAGTKEGRKEGKKEGRKEGKENSKQIVI